jgi:hypothetical protein
MQKQIEGMWTPFQARQKERKSEKTGKVQRSIRERMDDDHKNVDFLDVNDKRMTGTDYCTKENIKISMASITGLRLSPSLNP